jgi:hypothetical protein
VSATQLELSVRTPAPTVTPDEVARLVAELGFKTEWQTALQLAEALSINDRKVRAIAAAAMPQIVSFPGSPGYRLFQHCTIEEINKCIAAFESQGSDMFKRATLYRQAYHRRFRGVVS